MKRTLATVAAALTIIGAHAPATLAATQPEPVHDRRPDEPGLTVSGRGVVSARPDQAVVRLGAVVQAEDAASAQAQVNQIMQRALEAIGATGVPEESIRTVGLNLSPVYAQQRPTADGRHGEPRIVGYRAGNTVRVELDDLSLVGRVIDAGVKSGANQIEGLTFQLKDDSEQRREALRRAVREARAKAEAIAEAMEVRLERVVEVREASVELLRPQMEFMGRAAMAMDAGAPVQPGQVQVEASVTVRYRIAKAGGAD